MMEARLAAWADRLGYRAAMGPGALLVEVHREIQGRLDAGEFDPEFARIELGWLEDTPERLDAGNRTVFLVAVPRPAHTVTFTLPGGPVLARVPPGKVEGAQTIARVQSQLLEAFPALGDSLRLIRTGSKALAARLGLTAYGRNNLAYIEGIGSFFQLMAFSADALRAPCAAHPWARPAQMAGCPDCGFCRDECPTGAIPEDRFPLRGERCLDYFNESAIPWPGWLPAGGHNCLVGCLICQECCPENAGLLRVEDTGVVFDAEETAALCVPGAPVPASVQVKLEALGLLRFQPVLGRNLRALAGTALD